MAKKPTKPHHVYSLGDRVEVMCFGRGKITKLLGPLGPNRAEVYRVHYRRKPRPAFIEVLGNQLRLLKAAERTTTTSEPYTTPSPQD